MSDAAAYRAIVRRTALDPMFGLRERHIVIGSTHDAAHQKVRYVQRHVPKRRFYAAVAEPGAAFSIYPTQYSGAAWRREEVWVGVYVEFFRAEHTGQLRRRPVNWAALDISGTSAFFSSTNTSSGWEQDAREPPTSSQATLVRLAAVLRYTQAGYERMEKAADAIFAAQPQEP